MLVTLLLVTGAMAALDTRDLDQERLLNLDIAQGVETAAQKEITYKSAGDYTLVNIPWTGKTSLAFNDSTAATLSTIGNAALLVGGLYLLSGFPTALARSDPFGISRRFGAAAPAPPPKFYKPQHGDTKQQAKKKSAGVRKQRRPVERRGPAERQPAAEERQLPQLPKLFNKKPAEERQQLRVPQLNIRTPQLPQLRRPQLPSLRPFQMPQFRMPQLPSLRLPQLPGLRRPGPRPARPSAPRPAPAQAAAPAAAPAPESAPAPAAATPRPAPARQSGRPAAIIPPVAAAPAPAQSAPLTLPNPRPAAVSDFGSAFSTDPFSEFQNADFGDEGSFRDLIAAQFGDSFDLKRLPEN